MLTKLDMLVRSKLVTRTILFPSTTMVLDISSFEKTFYSLSTAIRLITKPRRLSGMDQDTSQQRVGGTVRLRRSRYDGRVENF